MDPLSTMKGVITATGHPRLGDAWVGEDEENSPGTRVKQKRMLTCLGHRPGGTLAEDQTSWPFTAAHCSTSRGNNGDRFECEAGASKQRVLRCVCGC